MKNTSSKLYIFESGMQIICRNMNAREKKSAIAQYGKIIEIRILP